MQPEKQKYMDFCRQRQKKGERISCFCHASSMKTQKRYQKSMEYDDKTTCKYEIDMIAFIYLQVVIRWYLHQANFSDVGHCLVDVFIIVHNFSYFYTIFQSSIFQNLQEFSYFSYFYIIVQSSIFQNLQDFSYFHIFTQCFNPQLYKIYKNFHIFNIFTHFSIRNFLKFRRFFFIIYKKNQLNVNVKYKCKM